MIQLSARDPDLDMADGRISGEAGHVGNEGLPVLLAGNS